MYPQAPGFFLQDWEEAGSGKMWMRQDEEIGKEVQISGSCK